MRKRILTTKKERAERLKMHRVMWAKKWRKVMELKEQQ